MRGKRFDGAGSGPVEPAGRDRAARDREEAAATDPAEHLTRDLARVRAKFGVDPALASRSLATAWRSETPVEEDEAEFVDAVADCLVVGLSLDDALNCWDAGELAYQAGDDGNAEPESEDETVPIPVSPVRRSPAAHRVLVR